MWRYSSATQLAKISSIDDEYVNAKVLVQPACVVRREYIDRTRIGNCVSILDS